jgi:hypothetical protein
MPSAVLTALDVLSVLFGVLLGVGLCALIWLDGERGERNYRIYRARHRDHSKVPSIK